MEYGMGECRKKFQLPALDLVSILLLLLDSITICGHKKPRGKTETPALDTDRAEKDGEIEMMVENGQNGPTSLPFTGDIQKFKETV